MEIVGIGKTKDAEVVVLSHADLGVCSKTVFAVSHAFKVLAHVLSHLGNELGWNVIVVGSISALRLIFHEFTPCHYLIITHTLVAVMSRVQNC